MIETLIASSALILGICLLRRLLKGRIAPQVQYSLWGIAAVRLMLPWFEWIFGWSGRISSRFSVMNGAAAFGRRLQDSGRLSSQAELPWGGLEYRALRLAGKLGEGGGENRTSDMWYVFFARPDCQEMYSIALNADLYSRDQILKTARSVHFTERAWTKP